MSCGRLEMGAGDEHWTTAVALDASITIGPNQSEAEDPSVQQGLRLVSASICENSEEGH